MSALLELYKEASALENNEADTSNEQYNPKQIGMLAAGTGLVGGGGAYAYNQHKVVSSLNNKMKKANSRASRINNQLSSIPVTRKKSGILGTISNWWNKNEIVKQEAEDKNRRAFLNRLNKKNNYLQNSIASHLKPAIFKRGLGIGGALAGAGLLYGALKPKQPQEDLQNTPIN